MTTKQRYSQVIEWFKTTMPVAETELHYDSPFHLLLAVILSAQCTDKRVNLITPSLFSLYPNPEDLAEASFDDVYEIIRSCSYPNNKARHLIGAAKMLVEEFNGEMPSDIDSLIKLPGVGRKTANVMLAVVFNKAAMAVDTHVFRVSEQIANRLLKPKRHCAKIFLKKLSHWLTTGLFSTEDMCVRLEDLIV